MTIAAHPDVTIYSSVTEENGVEAGNGVTIWTGSVAGATPGYLLLMATPGILLLMTSGGLTLV